MARIYDNLDLQFEEGLKNIIESPNVKRVDFCVGYFNLRGWKQIIDQIDELPGDYVDEDGTDQFRTCRLLIGMHRPNEEYIRILYGRHNQLPDAEMVQRCKIQIALDFKRQLLLGLPTAEDEQTLRRLSSQMKDKKVAVKLYLREPLHAKLYIAHKDDYACPRVCVMGSSNLTFAGLTKQGELNAEFSNVDETNKFYNWFCGRWEDRFCIDITKELIDVIDNSWATVKDIPPYYIYLKIAYHLSEEARNGIKEFTLTPEFRRELFDFQQNAVKIAARHLNNDKRGGAMIGDVVGLGKTITACAIAKIYEMTYASSTLIICPANLQDMW
ncbi:MAG: helicase, partial [Bacteroidales bacterium]|nr:helicase [Bacteroidales bacterium]